MMRGIGVAITLLGIAMGGVACVRNARAQQTENSHSQRPPPLACTLTAPTRVKVGDSIVVTMTVTNAGAKPLRVLTLSTPLDGSLLQASYEVRCNGNQLIEYRGFIGHNSGATLAGHYSELHPGGSIAGTADISEGYKLVPGKCTIQYAGWFGDVIDDPKIATHPTKDWWRAEPDCGTAVIEVFE